MIFIARGNVDSYGGKMTSFARIVDNKDFLFLRFEHIGNRSKFNSLMDDFNKRFPIKVWIDSRRAWQIPHIYRSELIQYCRLMFGSSGYSIEVDSSLLPPGA